MTHPSIRRVQIVSFALSHIPFLVLVAILASDGIEGDVFLLGVTLVATAITAVSLVVYLGHTLRGAGFPRVQNA